MSSHPRLVLTDILAILRADLGVYNLSTANGTHKVQLGEGRDPLIRPPFVWIAGPKVRSSNEAALTEIHKEGEILWRAFAAAPTFSTEARMFAALDLGEEIVGALHNGHANPAFSTVFQLTTLLVDINDVYGDGPDLPDGCGCVDGTIRYSTDRPRGG